MGVLSHKSCGSPQTDRTPEGVEVGDDALIESVESMALLFSEDGIGRDGSEETGRQRGVDAFEEFQKEDAQSIPMGQQAIAARALDQAFRARLRQVVPQGGESILVSRHIECAGRGRMEILRGEGIAARDMGEADERMHHRELARVVEFEAGDPFSIGGAGLALRAAATGRGR